jgi:hypothetical protein
VVRRVGWRRGAVVGRACRGVDCSN